MEAARARVEAVQHRVGPVPVSALRDDLFEQGPRAAPVTRLEGAAGLLELRVEDPLRLVGAGARAPQAAAGLVVAGVAQEHAPEEVGGLAALVACEEHRGRGRAKRWTGSVCSQAPQVLT